MRFSRKSVAAVSAAILTVAAGGAAWAAWSTSGSGSASSQATTAQAITVSAVTPTADLYPGGPAGVASFKLSNPNPYAVTLTGISYGSVASSDTTACPSSNVSVAAGAPSTVAITLAANASNVVQTIPGVVSMSHSAPDGCQGKSFSLSVTLTGAQA